MMTNSAAAYLAYDPTSAAVQADPYPYYASLRTQAPVHWNEQFNVWLLSRHADVSTVLRDPRWSSNYLNTLPRDTGQGTQSKERQPWQVLLFMDAADHRQLRRVVVGTLDGRLIGRVAAQAKAHACELLESVRARARFDLIGDFAAPLSLRMLTRLLGVADGDLPVIEAEANELSRLIDWSPSPAPLSRAADAGTAILPFFVGVVHQKRCQPGDDLISALVHQARQRKLRYSDIVSTAILLLAAGRVTSTHMIGNGVLAVLRTPAVLDAWKAGRHSTAHVLDELLRFDSPVQASPRTALADMTIGGYEIRRGQMVLALLGSANRDSTVFVDPDRLDPGRRSGGGLVFGAGPHFCIGAALARSVGAVALETLFEHRPNLRLANEPLLWMPTATQRGLLALHVTG